MGLQVVPVRSAWTSSILEEAAAHFLCQIGLQPRAGFMFEITAPLRPDGARVIP